MGWYNKVSGNNGLTLLPSCIDYFQKELGDARRELNLTGARLEALGQKLPGMIEYRYAQLQEVEAILEYLNIRLNQIRSHTFQKYKRQNLALSDSAAKAFAEGDTDYVDMAIVVNEFSLIRNKYIGTLKAIDQISWQIGNITRLRVAGLDDAQLS